MPREQVQIRRECLRVTESFRPNESENLNSQQLSSSFGTGFMEGLFSGGGGEGRGRGEGCAWMLIIKIVC